MVTSPIVIDPSNVPIELRKCRRVEPISTRWHRRNEVRSMKKYRYVRMYLLAITLDTVEVSVHYFCSFVVDVG